MATGWLLSALTYLAAVVFIGGAIRKAVQYARAPMHLRWELYPVPHEKGKEYGGSYFEEADWWAHPRETSLAAEIRAMLEEILLIRSLWHRNRPQWYASFPFHVGIYFLAALVVLILLGAALEIAGAATALGPLWGAVQLATVLCGAIGIISASAGAMALLWRRVADPNLKRMSTTSDYFNLLFILVAFLSAGFAWLTTDNSFGLLREYFRAVLSFSAPAGIQPAVAAEVAAASLFLIYLPFTHMTHFVAKYFTYHQVRWDDAPNLGDPRMLARLQANLARPVGWSAPHIQPDRNWAEVATEVK